MNFEDEIIYKTARSAGKGGQHVNKVETKVTVLLNISGSAHLNEEQKLLIQQKLRAKMNASGYLYVSSQSERSQLANKEIAVKKLYQLIEQALKKKKWRVATKPTKASKEKRIINKKHKSAIKVDRKNIKWKED